MKGFVCFGDFAESSLRRWHNWNVEKRQDRSPLIHSGFRLGRSAIPAEPVWTHTPPPGNPCEYTLCQPAYLDLKPRSFLGRCFLRVRPLWRWYLYSCSSGQPMKMLIQAQTSVSTAGCRKRVKLFFLKSDPVSDPLTFTCGSLIS